MSRGALAAKCAQLGYPEITANVITELETGRVRSTRRRPVTVDELYHLAEALHCSPLVLLPHPGEYSGHLGAQDTESIAAAIDGLRAVQSILEAQARGQLPES
jgi:hypothetical protein